MAQDPGALDARVADVLPHRGEDTGRAAVAAAIAAARARHPSVAPSDAAPARPVLTLVTDPGPRPVPELPLDGPDGPPADGVDGTPAPVGPFRDARRPRRSRPSRRAAGSGR